MLTIADFSKIAKEKIGLSDLHLKAICETLADHFIEDSFDFKFLIEIFK